MKPVKTAGIEENSISICTCIALCWHSMTVRRVCLKLGGEAYVYYNIHTMHSGLQLNSNFIKTSQCLPRGSYHHMWRLSWVAANMRNGHVVTNTMSSRVTASDGFSLHRAIYSGENHTNLTNNWGTYISLFYFLHILYLHFCLFSIIYLLFKLLHLTSFLLWAFYLSFFYDSRGLTISWYFMQGTHGSLESPPSLHHCRKQRVEYVCAPAHNYSHVKLFVFDRFRKVQKLFPFM
jgi:hypothetical protein